MSEDMRKEEFQEAVAKYFPKCPLCGGKSLEFNIEFGRRYDHVICHNCNASWEIDWKGEGFEIESIRLVEVEDVEKAGLKDGRHRPEFWQRMALQAKEAQPIAKEKEVIKEKEVDPQLRRRLEFLRKERATKIEEMKSEEKLAKLGAISGILGGGSTLRQQQHLHRVQDLAAEVRRLTFEIGGLEAETEKKEEKRINVHVKDEQQKDVCPSCGKDVSWLPADATNCPYCGAKLKQLFEE